MQNVANSIDPSADRTLPLHCNYSTKSNHWGDTNLGLGACDNDFNTNSLCYSFIVHSLVQDKSADLAAKSQWLIRELIHGGSYLSGWPDCLHEQPEQHCSRDLLYILQAPVGERL